ncbi:MAG: M48 family metallopeptidase [Bacteroidota bacterium]
MAEIIFIFIIAILVFDYLLERLLDYLNSTYWSNEIPKELEGIYDAEKYKKSQDYQKVNQKFSLLTSSLSFIAMLLMILLGGFAIVDEFARQFTLNPILLALLFFGIIGFVTDLFSTPFTIYDTFVIEQKFGFNTTTVKTFVLDKLKAWLLALVLGGGLLALFVLIYTATGNNFWWIAWLSLSLVTVFFTMFYSNLIVPLFNKQTPLENGELRDAIHAFASKTGFQLKNIFVIDGSKRSNKANAYFTGLGAKKRIVLYDTLIKDHTTEELVAVLAHEIGHYKKKHSIQGMIISLLETGLMLFILSWFIGKFNQDLGLALGVKPSFHIGILVFGMLYSPLSLILGLALNILSRKHEYQADRFAGENYDTEALKNALKKLSVNNLSNLKPHPAYVFFHYSHPTLLQRIAALNKINKQ